MKYVLMLVIFFALVAVYWMGFYRGYIYGYADGVVQCVSVMQSDKEPATQNNVGI